MHWGSFLRRHVTYPCREVRYSAICTQRPGLSELLPKVGNPFVPYAISKPIHSRFP
ncbi:hypothetical protein DPMN_127116 [Dreissena polymorpha]|uniref:Uncharacterized protein n=1 Tax=Dreissena polymorpha TaxID=45954 RepID=A0A9D4H4M6_DREPO|nr:hypothetical protein DPMN_127116 [Dreissena polymorpha]